MFEKLKILASYDERGEVYDANKFVVRKIYDQFLAETLDIITLYEKNSLEDIGVVKTEKNSIDGQIYLKHQKHIISYPHEWTVSMFKDAAMFHINLFLKLDSYDLTLRDAHLTNVLFDFTKPVYIDFFSIIYKQKLGEEQWLKDVQKSSKDNRQLLIFDKMFFPYIIIPSILFYRRRFNFVRKMLKERACNINSNVPSWKDLKRCYGSKGRLGNLFFIIKLYLFLNKTKKTNIKSFYKSLLRFIENLNLLEKRSDYSSYYLDKNENFSFENQKGWRDKQKAVFSILKEFKPKSVLDIGSNTGWFSILAEKMGAKVVAIDIDESSIDNLYLYSKKNNLNILSLNIPFESFESEVFGMNFKQDIYTKRNFDKNPIFISPVKRLRSDIVLCLALFHHLVLGENRNVADIFRIFNSLASKVLVLEFIDLFDPLIKKHGEFFSFLDSYNEDNYSLDIVINEGLKYFDRVKILDSHPNSRKILVFDKT